VSQRASWYRCRGYVVGDDLDVRTDEPGRLSSEPRDPAVTRSCVGQDQGSVLGQHGDFESVAFYERTQLDAFCKHLGHRGETIGSEEIGHALRLPGSLFRTPHGERPTPSRFWNLPT
jgi:hypothetical protein